MPNKFEIEIMRVIGARMREARGLCGKVDSLPMSANEAAGLLGVTSKQLLAIENCTDVELIPLAWIVRASRVFDVGIDFLFGFSDDWENDPMIKFERQVGHWVFEETTKTFAALAVENRKLQARVAAMCRYGGVLKAPA